MILNTASLVFYGAARKVRSGHNNAIVAILLSMAQGVLFLAVFYLMFTILGQRGMAIRGNYLLYLLTGIFAYLTHIQSVSAVMGAENATSPMMQHAPMNTLVSILSAALSTLYIKVISLGIILFFIHTLFEPISFQYWPGALGMFLLSWASGCTVGLVFMALAPWRPELINIIKMVYIRANMIASGKMFVANMLPSALVALFDWNPLFHIIDQARGFTFVNYAPHYSNWQYPVYAALVLLVIGMMGENYTRKHISASWSAKY
ncbi:MAG: ABC transporter permease [Pseudomonadota bacterium]